MKTYIGKFIIVICAAALFMVTQYISDFSVGAWDWFFTHFPPKMSLDDYKVALFIAHPLSDFLISWAPVTCLALSILLFMDKKNGRAFLLIAAPLVPAIISGVMFYNAAQIHVAPGENLFASGVLLDKKPSYALSQDSEQDTEKDAEQGAEHAH